MEFIETLLKILLINLILSGDNAVVIAMASRNLPEHLKQKAVVWGTLGAVAFRILFTLIVIYLLQLPFIHLVGGLLLLVVAYKLLVDQEEENNIKVGSSLRDAIATIIFADVLMSLDNVLAIVAVSGSDMVIIFIGIIMSIPIIMFASHLILNLMESYPIVIYIGAALLAWTAGEMMLKEGSIQQFISPNSMVETTLLIGLIFLVLGVGATKRKVNERS
ncbi:YjbE family putative metal transport protein [Ornithinibacillus halophilus]|uniref:Integral membrane protein, YjbE family n=1 Tax=Ornithinibacillus halophilus TaxID=930117 RepID=A0A1M5NN31_9BACI|nr:YjbE family putative metal transport protein [Ornithinibacillus halophilus]SHG90898.1 integral membrane protein, YjbE family [Ornithinibacillus halophilus]